MTKEEILKNELGLLPYKNTMIGSSIGNCILLAMDEYAKQQTIAFDHWKLNNSWVPGYQYGSYIRHTLSNDLEESSFNDLYNLFIEQQNK